MTIYEQNLRIAFNNSSHPETNRLEIQSNNCRRRYNFQYNINIFGLPEREMQESASKTVSLCINLFKAPGIKITNQDIDIAHHIPARTATSGPQPIVCKFTRRTVKEQVMNARNKACK